MGALPGIFLRIVPFLMTTFMTLFGKKIANVVRIATVFWASCAPVLRSAETARCSSASVRGSSTLAASRMDAVVVVVVVVVGASAKRARKFVYRPDVLPECSVWGS